MDIVYTSLDRRPTTDPPPADELTEAARAAEAAEAVNALWAHAVPADGLEHASAEAGPDRLDLLLYLLPPDPTRPTAPGATHRAAALLARSHQASPLLRRRYLPPPPRPQEPCTRHRTRLAH